MEKTTLGLKFLKAAQEFRSRYLIICETFPLTGQPSKEDI
jgi:hypothetical protein